jgi:hypothetical protein
MAGAAALTPPKGETATHTQDLGWGMQHHKNKAKKTPNGAGVPLGVVLVG